MAAKIATTEKDSWQTFLTTDATQILNPPAASIEWDELRPAGSVGTEACVACHPTQYETYLATSHSRSVQQLTPENTKHLSGTLAVIAEKRRFEVSVADGKLVHREVIEGVNHKPVATTVGEMAYEIGSGEHAHSYLFRSGGYLIQSPLTWYTSLGKWALSPGYRLDNQASFDRVVTTNCLFCHVGSIRTHGNHQERFLLQELTIGCERCHGRGEQHVKAHRLDASLNKGHANPDPGDVHNEIINPKRLTRALNEAICAQCHLQGLVASAAEGASRWDFRPGESLSSIVTEFQLYGTASSFRIVGHTEQMQNSKCYQESETLTCTICHDPHGHTAQPSLKQKAVEQRAHCVSCHQNAICSVPLATRVATQQDNCVICHMPRRETNVPHAALHDHRISIHSESFSLANLAMDVDRITPDPVTFGKPRLVAINDDQTLPEWQRQRRWALAMHSLAFTEQLPNSMRDDLPRAESQLLDLYRDGHTDANLLVCLSRDYLAANQLVIAGKLAQRAIDVSKPGTPGHIGAVDVMGQLALRDQDNEAARRWYRELTSYRRLSGDFILLAFCENNAGNRREAIASLETALQIDPLIPFAHELMAGILEADGQSSRAQAHREVLAELR